VAFDFSADNTCYVNSKCPSQNSNGDLSCTREPPKYCPSGYERRTGYSTKIIGNEQAHDAFKRKATQPYGCEEKSKYSSYKTEDAPCKPVLDADALRLDSFDDLPTGHTALNINNCAEKCNTRSECNAFEYSETTRYCYMFKDPEPESTTHEFDFMFCAKPVDVTNRLKILGYAKTNYNGPCYNDDGPAYGVYSDLLSMSECISFCEEETYCTGVAMTTKDHPKDPNRCIMYGEITPFKKKYDYGYKGYKAAQWRKYSWTAKSGFIPRVPGYHDKKYEQNTQCWRNPDYVNGGIKGGKKPRDNNKCLQDSRSDRKDWTCSDREDKCTSLMKTMYRCCPETCGNGWFGTTREICETINRDGECRSPSQQIEGARRNWPNGQGKPYKYERLKEREACKTGGRYG